MLNINAHRMADMTKIEFHYLLGERRIPRQYNGEDYDRDLENLSARILAEQEE
jgi:predicted HTH domain antitoxin